MGQAALTYGRHIFPASRVCFHKQNSFISSSASVFVGYVVLVSQCWGIVAGESAQQLFALLAVLTALLTGRKFFGHCILVCLLALHWPNLGAIIFTYLDSSVAPNSFGTIRPSSTQCFTWGEILDMNLVRLKGLTVLQDCKDLLSISLRFHCTGLAWISSFARNGYAAVFK